MEGGKEQAREEEREKESQQRVTEKQAIQSLYFRGTVVYFLLA